MLTLFICTCCVSQAEENKDEHMDEMLKKIKEHEAYVSKVGFTGLILFHST